jgi:hypothetical protein
MEAGHTMENLVDNWMASCVSMETLHSAGNVSAKKITMQRLMSDEYNSSVDMP